MVHAGSVHDERIERGMSTGATGGTALVGVALRGGGTLSVWADRLEAPGASYPMAEIAWAGLVNDPAAPAGAQPLPSVAWRTTSGQYASATPADPPQAWQVLEALFAQRPDLRIPLPPPGPSLGQPGVWGPPPPGPMPGFAYAPGYAPYGPAQQPDHNQTVMAGLSHLSIFFGALIVPLILWLVNRGKSPYAAQQSKQAFFFHLGVWIIDLVILIPGMIIYFTSFFSFMENMPTDPTQAPAFPVAAFTVFIIMYAIILVVQIIAIVFGVIGAVKAFQGKPFHYPLLGRV